MRTRRWTRQKGYLAVLGCTLTTGCAAFSRDVSSATTTAVDAATSPAAEQRYQEMAVAVVGAARDKVLDSDTTQKTQALIGALSEELRTQLLATRDAMLDKKFQTEVATLRAQLLGAETRKLLRAMVDEALGATTRQEAGLLREELTGAPLRQSMDDLIDEAAPHLANALQTSLVTVKADAAAEADHYKSLALALAAAAAALIVALGVAVHLVRTHRTVLQAVLARLERLERG